MASTKSKTARRREVRRQMPRPGFRWLAGAHRRHVLWAVGYAGVLAVLGTLIAISAGAERHRYQLGQFVNEPIVSRVPFEAVNPQATLDARNEAAGSVPQIYLPNRQFLERLQRHFDGLMAFADYESIDEIPSDYRDQVHLNREALAELRRFKDADDNRSMQQWEQLTEGFLRSVFDLAILRDPPRQLGVITLRHPNPAPDMPRELQRTASVLYDVEDPAAREKIERDALIFPPALRQTVVAIVTQNLEPTYVFDQEAAELTQQRRQERYEQVEPVIERHDADELLIPAGTELQTTHLDLLAAEEAAYQQAQTAEMRTMRRAGIAAIMLALAAGLWTYIYFYNERITRNPLRGLALTGLLLLGQALAVGATQFQPALVYVSAIFPTLLVALVIAIAYDQRFALAIGALHAAIVVVSLDLSVGFALVLMVGVGTAVLVLQEVKNRSSIVAVGFWSGLAMGAAVVLVAFATRPIHLEGELPRIFFDTALATVTGLFTGLLVQGCLPAIEKLFKVNTAMTLKELNDASHPLLQRLAQEAPGTYQHSLRIADIAEAAAEAINADSLLCRVGAMYHDIGKTNKPSYFIENQAGGVNRHGKLSPAMSLLIIVGHVKDGIEMAREYHLPPAIRHFIESHHGTTLVEYFYHAARKQKAAQDAPAPSEFEFRYAGPKPRTREAAIMLLCDSIEAAARSLAEPTPVRLEQIVHHIAVKRLMDGQFDECNLTLNELHRIEQAITKTLCAIYHARITYPGDATAPATPAGEAARRPSVQPAAS